MSILGQAKQLIKEEEGVTDDRALPPEDPKAAMGYVPRELQAHIEDRERRFNVEVVHRRFGKTVMKVAKLLDRACYCPFDEGRYAYAAPTYTLAEDIAWAYLERFHYDLLKDTVVNPSGRRWRNASKLAVWVPTRRGDRARVRLYGLDTPKQRMRGLYLDGVVMDEFAHIPWSVWSEQVRPMLADDVRQGVDERGYPNQWADFIFTPFGRNHGYTLLKRALAWSEGKDVVIRDASEGTEETVRRDDYFACYYPASQTSVLSDEEKRAMFHDMGRPKYLQEVECSFDAAVEGAIYAKEIEWLREQGRVTGVPANKLLPVNTAWDLGWDDATAIWFFQQVGDEVRLVDYYEASGADLSHYADVMVEKGYRYGYNLFPHDVEQHELGTGKSRASVLRQLGVRVSTVPRHRPWDGIAACQALLPRCVFDETRCAEGLDRLAMYRREWNERLQVFRQNPVHDWASHGADAFRTLAMGLRRAAYMGHADPSTMTHAQF